jgi:hypothetical protein
MIRRQGKTLHGGEDERRRPPWMTQVVVQKKVEVGIACIAKNKHSEVFGTSRK